MIRVMAWNIERFGVNKLMTNAWDLTAQRGQFIAQSVVNVNPDVFIIIEVQTNAHNAFGGVISDTSGAPGVMAILMHLQAVQAGAGWSVVPPLVISPAGGYSEGIAVFYKSAVFNFWGPNMWNGLTSEPLQIGQSVAYTGLWAGALPNRASGIPGPFQENTLAGKFAFWNGNVLINFPNANARAPWYTLFNEIATGRLLKLFAVHFPPKAYLASQAFQQFANVGEVTGIMTPTEDRIVLGDFNLNALNPAQTGSFATLTGGPVPVNYPQYVQMITGASPNPATMLKSVTQASTTGAAPYYNYSKQDSAGNQQSLDNAFVVRGGAAAAPLAVVGNSVVGTLPMFPIDLAAGNTIPNIIANVHAGGARAKRFRTLVNFGHIGAKRGASDHMPIVVDLP